LIFLQMPFAKPICSISKTGNVPLQSVNALLL
jgi:hypothetical protein